MTKCSVCEEETKNDEFTDYEIMVCINCATEESEDDNER